VLEGDLGALDLASLGLAAQVPDELGALREAGGAERVALGQEAARGIGDELTAVGVVAVPDELLGLALLAQAERLVGESSLAVKQSWSSTTSTSSGPMPACS